MSKLKELKTKIELIPEKSRKANLVGKLSRYDKMTAEARDTLVRSSVAKQHALVVFPDGDFQRVVQQAQKAAVIAKKLRNRLSKNLESIEKSDDEFATINDHAKAAQNALRDQWSSLMRGKVQDFENLVKAAKEAGLEGSQKLDQTLTHLREQVNNPPKSNDSAISAKAGLDNLVDSVRGLGLEGEAGQFLVDASEGKGDPQLLYKPEIKQLIDRYQLWGLLRVKLR